MKKEDIKLFDTSIDEIIINLKNNEKIINYNSFFVRRSKNIISLENQKKCSECYYIFKNPINIYYKNYEIDNDYLTLVDKSVKSTVQIEKTMQNYNIEYLIYQDKNIFNFPECKSILFEIINDNSNFEINFICPIKKIKYIQNNYNLNSIPDDLKTLIIYFEKYFEYSEQNIKYFETEERKNFFDY